VSQRELVPSSSRNKNPNNPGSVDAPSSFCSVVAGGISVQLLPTSFVEYIINLLSTFHVYQICMGGPINRYELQHLFSHHAHSDGRLNLSKRHSTILCCLKQLHVNKMGLPSQVFLAGWPPSECFSQYKDAFLNHTVESISSPGDDILLFRHSFADDTNYFLD
jgi:hypothetical protein